MDKVSREDAIVMIEATWEQIRELELQRRQIDQKIEELVNSTVLLERTYLL